MADYALTGKELKRHIKLARDTPLPFAYNPGGPKDEDYFAMHRKRSAEIIGKAAKKDGPGSKAAFGKAVVDGRVLELRCDVVVAGIARKLKQHLKASKISMNIRICDANGTVLEEDIEELADDPDLFDDSPEAGDEDTATFAEEDDKEALEDTGDADAKTEDEQKPDAAPAINAADLVAGLKRLQPAIAAAPAPVAEKLKAVVGQVAGQIKGGELETAQATLEKLEAAVAKLPGASPAQPEAAAPPPPSPPEAEPAPGPTADNPDDDDRLRRLAERAKAVQAQVAGAQVPDDVREKLMAAFQNAVGALKTRDLDTAETLLDKIAEALTRLSMASDSIRDGGKDAKKKANKEKADKAADGKPETLETAEGPEGPDAAATDNDDFDEKAHDLADKIETLRTKMVAQFGLEIQTALGERLDRAEADLEAGVYSTAQPAMTFVQEAMRLQDAIDALMPDYVRAASTGSVEDVQRMRILFDSAVELVAGPDHAKAWGYLQKVQDMIQDGASKNVNAFLADIPEDVRPFAMSRLNWTSARTAMKGEMDKLRDGITRAVAGQPEYQGVLDNIGALYDHIEGLDMRLAGKLDEVVNAEPGNERQTRKVEARTILAEYQSELSKPFFQDVDANNGFSSVAVASTAREALGEIDRVLAA